MHLTADTGCNAAAIMWGLKDRDLAICDTGVVEQYAVIGEAADFLTQHEAAIAQRLEYGFPGVFAYEVAEELGEWMKEHFPITSPIDFHSEAKAQATKLLAEFFLGNLSSEGQEVEGDNRSDYVAALEYLSAVLPGDWSKWYARLEVKERKKTETSFEFPTIAVPWVVGDTVYLRDGGYVRKGEIKRIICAQSVDTADKRDQGTNVEVQWQGYSNIVMLSSSDVAKLKRTAEEAFA